MRVLFATVFISAVVFAGALTGAMAASGRVSFDVNGHKRVATILERARLKRAPRPLIIVLRAAGSAPRRLGLSRVDRFLGLDEAAGAATVLAFPSSGGARWDLDAGKTDDVAMVRALAARMIADGIADRRKIYLAGVSSGGLLALRVLCDGADYLAGAAVLLANMPASLAKSCKPARPAAFLLLNGTLDPLMPYQGGEAKLVDFKGEVAGTDATLAPFALAAECGKARPAEALPDKNPNDGTRVFVERSSGCKAPVELFRIEGGGHALPGWPVRADRGEIVGARNNDIDTARILIDFFRRAAR